MTIFSRIIAGEIPCYKIAEDDKFFAFLDINPLTKGHVLVIPKIEEDYLFDLTDETLGEMMIFAKEIASHFNIFCLLVSLFTRFLQFPFIPIQLVNHRLIIHQTDKFLSVFLCNKI